MTRRAAAGPAHDDSQLSLFGFDDPADAAPTTASPQQAATVAVPQTPPSRWPTPTPTPAQPRPDTPGAAPAVPTAPAPRPEAPRATAAPPPADLVPPGLHHHPRANRQALLAGHAIRYELKRARRRTIGFVVSDAGLTVSAPRWVPQAEIDAGLQEKSRWILRKLTEQAERVKKLDSARIAWGDGAVLPFLGEPVVVVLDARITGARLDSGQTQPQATLAGVPRLALHVGLPPSATPEQVRDQVQAWLQRQARRIFEERCAVYAERLKVRVRRLGLSSAGTRWGSASADGSIRLNWRLVHLPMATIDYVVCHELAHLRHMDHSPRFWDVVRSVLPDYEAAKEGLRDEAVPPLE